MKLLIETSVCAVLCTYCTIYHTFDELVNTGGDAPKLVCPKYKTFGMYMSGFAVIEITDSDSS